MVILPSIRRKYMVNRIPRGATVPSRLLIIPRELYVVKAFFCLFRCSLLSEAARRFIIGREDSGAERERLPAVP